MSFIIGRNGFDSDRNNNENSGQRTRGFGSNRGGEFWMIFFVFNKCFWIARNGDYQDRNNRFRNNQDEGNNENDGAQRFGST